MNRPSKYTYPAIFTREETGYSVRFPQLDGCYTQGDTFEEAQRMASEAMSLHLYGMEQDGEEIPEADMALSAEANEMIVHGLDDALPGRNGESGDQEDADNSRLAQRRGGKKARQLFADPAERAERLSGRVSSVKRYKGNSRGRGCFLLFLPRNNRLSGVYGSL